MPPTSNEVAARALEAAQAAAHAAEIAKMVGEEAKRAAEAAKMTAESMVIEMRTRFDRSDENSENFRNTLMTEIQGQNRTFDAFKSDFEKDIDRVDRRCVGHNEAIFGNAEKNIPGMIKTVDQHDSDIHKGKWTIWLAGIVIGWAIVYVAYFYGDAMKRGVFNPSEEEWRWRVSREVRKTVKPDALVPQVAPSNN